MKLWQILAPALEENCYILLPPESNKALVIDPGAGSKQRVLDIIAGQGASVEAVLLTHGHPDHVWDAAAVAGQAPVYIPGPDKYRLRDPGKRLGSLREIFSLFSGPWVCPPQVLQVPDLAYSQPWEIVPQVFLRALPAPGHTEGSSLFLAEFACQWIPEQGEELSFPSGPLAFCGDVIFAGSVGRSDLPGGDSEVMTESLRIITKVVHPATRLFPGHGPITTLREEITHNPYFPR